MRLRRIKATLLLLVFTSVAGFGGLMWVARSQAISLITSPPGQRRPIERTPADLGLPYRDVDVVSSDGIRLEGWELPSRNGATVMLQHGYKVNRSWRILDIAEVLNRHGFGVLLTTVRAHDLSDGAQITFGHEEMKDVQAFYDYLLSRPGSGSQPIGAFGNSMGGSLMIQFAAQTPGVRAVVAQSAFSSLLDTVDVSVRSFTGLPPFPFAPMIRFWVERQWGFDAATIDFTRWIHDISPRPVFLMQGGADEQVSSVSGQRLLDAAGNPKELWFEPKLGHATFNIDRPKEFERRVVAFYERYLLAERPTLAAAQ